MMGSEKVMLKMEMEHSSIQMVYVTKDSSKTICDMAMEFFDLIKSKFIEANGTMTNCQAKAKLEILQLLINRRHTATTHL